jgi:hypothetical protein
MELLQLPSAKDYMAGPMRLLITTIKLNYRTILGAWLGTTIVVYLLTFIMPTVYSGVAMVRVGQSGFVESQSIRNQPFETTQDAISRVNSLSFQLETLNRVSPTIDPESSEGRMFLESIGASAGPVASSIILRVQGYGTDEVKRQLTVLSDLLRERHKVAADAALRFQSERLKNLQKELELAIEAQARVRTMLDGALAVDSTGDGVDPIGIGVIGPQLMNQLTAEVSRLRREIFLMEQARSDLWYWQTGLLEPVAVSNRPVGPRRAVISGVAGLVALVAMMIFAISRTTVDPDEGDASTHALSTASGRRNQPGSA